MSRVGCKSRRLLVSDRRQRRNWLRNKLLADFEPGYVYTCVPVEQLASIPSNLLLNPGDIHEIREARA